MCAKFSSKQKAGGGQMFSSIKFNSFFALILIPPIFFLSTCGIEKSEYGKKSDYQKLGANCTKTADTIRPTVSSDIPADNSTFNSVATTAVVTFSETMSPWSITTNTSDTTCSGSFQLSSDNFSTCIKMSAAPEASNDNKTFTLTPASNLSAETTFKRRITSSIADTSCNSFASTNTTNGFSTSPSGSGTITGSVQDQRGNALSGVEVTYTLHGTQVDDTTSDSSGDFSEDSLGLGIHTLTYTKDDYNNATLTDTLETDGQTLVVETIRLVPDNCTSATMSGKITDAVTGSGISEVTMSYAASLCLDECEEYTYFDTTDTDGAWSLSTASADWFTIKSHKTGYYDDTFGVFGCGTQTNQNNAISASLNEGEMRIMLKWPATDPETAVDLDSHLEIPYSTPRVSGTACDGDSDKNDLCHLYYGTNQGSGNAVNLTGVSTEDYHIYTDIVSSGDYVTLDKDHNDNSDPAAPPGDETITISKVRSGTYSYSVHNYSDKDLTTGDADAKRTNLKKSRVRVKVLYCAAEPCQLSSSTFYKRRFNVPNKNGTLWTVFTFDKDSSSVFTRVKTMSEQDTQASIY